MRQMNCVKEWIVYFLVIFLKLDLEVESKLQVVVAEFLLKNITIIHFLLNLNINNLDIQSK